MEFIVLDLETTGLNPQKDRIIEIGGVKITNGTLGEEFSTLINPQCFIPDEITELTGINDSLVKNMPAINEVVPSLIEFMEDRLIVGHNISFDLGFLNKYLLSPREGIDTVELSKIIFPHHSSYALNELAYTLGIKNFSAHRALEDAKVTGKLLLILLQELKKIDLMALETLFVLTQKISNPLKLIIAAEYKLRMVEFSQEKIKPRKLYATPSLNQGLFFTQPPDMDENYQISPQEIALFFHEDGVMEDYIPGFTYRHEQREMAQGVAKCFNQGGNFLVEAGTGTGKSLAYLLPAVLWSKKSGHKVIISTHTINLQEQLKFKDLPLVKKICGFDFRGTVLKGRGHYLCSRKWEFFYGETNQEILPLMCRLVLWLQNTETGDIDELNLNWKEKKQWSELAALSETCWGGEMPIFPGTVFFL